MSIFFVIFALIFKSNIQKKHRKCMAELKIQKICIQKDKKYLKKKQKYKKSTKKNTKNTKKCNKCQGRAVCIIS